MITDGHGLPLAVILTGGYRNDVTQLLPLIDPIPPIRGRVGHPRRKPDSVFADRGYDHDIYRDQVRKRRIVPAIVRLGTLHGTELGKYRWVVERSFAWPHGFERLRIREEHIRPCRLRPAGGGASSPSAAVCQARKCSRTPVQRRRPSTALSRANLSVRVGNQGG